MATFLVASTPCWAIQGAKPIHSLGGSPPYTIDKSGSYVLTRDISVKSSDVIRVIAKDVTIDLQGHHISIDSTGHNAVGTAIIAMNPDTRLVISDGQLIGGKRGILATRSLHVTDLHITDARTGIEAFEIEALDARSCSLTVAQHGVIARGEFAPIMLNNRIVLTHHETAAAVAMILRGARSGRIEDNVITTACDDYCHSPDGVMLSGWGGTLIQGNSITCVDCSNDGRGLAIESPNNIVANNVIMGFADWQVIVSSASNIVNDNIIAYTTDYCGLSVTGGHNRIRGNQIRGHNACGISLGGTANRVVGNSMARVGEDGIHVSGTLNLIDNNQFGEATMYFERAVIFSQGTQSNAYRANMLLGYQVAVQDSGTNNRDAGGNICNGECVGPTP
jgi:hypothetical protein